LSPLKLILGFSDYKGFFEQLKTVGCSGKTLQEVSLCVHDFEWVPCCHGMVCPWVDDTRDSPHLWNLGTNVVNKQL